MLLQVAANARGIQLVTDLIEEYGLGTVQAYMGFIQVLTSHPMHYGGFVLQRPSICSSHRYAGQRRGSSPGDAVQIFRGSGAAEQGRSTRRRSDG